MQNSYNANRAKNIISIDVEEWYQAILFNRNDYYDIETTNLPQNIAKILTLLDRYNTKATFFIVGLVAKKYPEVIKAIASRGHEIASHGYLHRPVYKLSKQEFIEDIKLSLDTFRKNIDTEVVGYRAPTWSISRNTPWALEVLESLGFKYDSSLLPFSVNLFTSRNLKRFPYKIKDDFFEFPPSTFRLLNCNFPFSGGTFLRFFSSSFIINKIKDINKNGYPAMVYFHSWEFDDKASELNIPGWKRYIQFYNLFSLRGKLDSLFSIFNFYPIRNFL